MTPAESLPAPPPVPLTLVQRAALALATPAKPGGDPAAAIVSAEPSHARLRFFTPPNQHASILPGGDGLEPALAEVIAGWTEGILHVVVLGADPETAKQLWKRHVPAWGGKRAFSLHVRDATGKVRMLRGIKLPQLQEALDRAGALDGASPELRDRLQALQATGSRTAQEADAFQQALRSKSKAVTVALVVACLAVFALESLFEATSTPRVLSRMGAMGGDLLLRGQWWRVLSLCFLHAGPWHVGLNMVALYSLGSQLERIFGWRRFLILYAICAAGGSLAIAVSNPQVLSVGCSGALWGLMAFELYTVFRPGGLFPEMIAHPLKKAAGRIAAINIGISLLPGVSFAAHLGGGLVGLALAASGLLSRGVRPVTEDPQPPASPALTAGGALSAIALGASLLYAMAWGRPWDFAHPELSRVELADGFSVSLPAVRTRIEQHDDKDGSNVVTFGDFYNDGAIYRVLLGPAVPGAVADETSIEALKGTLANQPLAGHPRQGKMAVEQLGGHPVVTDYVLTGATRTREWSTFRGGHLVMMNAVEIAQTGKAPWEALATPIFLSIEPPPAPR